MILPWSPSTFLAQHIFLPWIWRQYVHPKRR
jgi:hypothetical protein